MGAGGSKKPSANEEYKNYDRGYDDPDKYRPIDNPHMTMNPIMKPINTSSAEKKMHDDRYEGDYDKKFAELYEKEEIEIDVYAKTPKLKIYEYKGTALEMFGKITEKASNPSGHIENPIAIFMDDIFNNRIESLHINITIDREVSQQELPKLTKLLTDEINDFGKICMHAAKKIEKELGGASANKVTDYVRFILNKCEVMFYYKETTIKLRFNVAQVKV